jgi:hypothetical protein
MRHRLIILSHFLFLGLCLATGCPVPLAAQAVPCELPSGAREIVAAKYKDARLLTLQDLSDDDKKLFQESHHGDCPGLAKLGFYGDGKPTLALVLISAQDSKRMAKLIVAHQTAAGWKTRTLDTTDWWTPVVWSEAPGKYNDVWGNKTIQARNPVIVFCGYHSWAVVYAWNGKTVEKVWLQD